MADDSKLHRRDFLARLLATSSLAAAAPSSVLALPRRAAAVPAPERTLRLATIGMGIIGFVDTQTALKVPGVKLVAAADLYEGRRIRTREVFGADVDTTGDYGEILARPDVDAVIVSTPDHWHAKITIEALEAGKHVYCEKPMVQTLEQGTEVVAAQRRTQKVVQVGSQYVSSLIHAKARELFRAGAIGQLSLVEANWNRISAVGAWQYSLPADASLKTIDWDRFLGPAPKRPFDILRFFRWRNYWDYGTGIPGDLFVHLLSGIHYVLGAHGPTQVLATGGLRYWHDGREVPDVLLGLYDYPETDSHPAFTLALQSNFVDGGGGGSVLRFTGSEGVMTLGFEGVTLSKPHRSEPTETALVEGYNSVRTFSRAGREAFVSELRQRSSGEPPRLASDGSTQYRVAPGYDPRLDHLSNFFAAIAGGDPVVEDAAFSLRAAAPALLANRSYLDRRAYGWDPQAMQLVEA